MNPTRPIHLEPGLRPTAATPTVTLTGDRRGPLPRLEPDVARLRPLDRDAALRILIEEVKSALIEKFGTLPLVSVPAPTSARASGDGATLLSDVARLLHTLLVDLAGENEELADATLDAAAEAVQIGGRRALDAIAQMPHVAADVRVAVEQLRWLLVRMVEVQARTLRGRVRRRVEENAEGDDAPTRLPYEVERDREDDAG